MEKISIIVPCYNEEEVLPLFYREIGAVSQKMPEQILEVIFINDGSRDGTLKLLKQFAETDQSIKFISFSRNFGKEAAMYAGLQHADGDYVVFMDADMQDPPSLLPKMYEIIKNEDFDSVATCRVTRKGEPPVRSFFAKIFYKLMNKFSNTEIKDGARDFRLMNRKFADALLDMKEYNRFSKGLFGWVGYKTKWLEFENVERAAGETKWSFWKLFKYSLEGITAFSTVPLVLSSILGVLFCGISFIFIVLIIIRKILFNNSVDGWASMVCLISMIGGIQLFAIGIVGQYISKMYLEIKRRPIYLISESKL